MNRPAKHSKLLRPDDNLWVADIVFVVIAMLMFAPVVYALLFPHEQTYEHAGPGMMDDSAGWIGEVLGIIMLLFLIAVLATALTRLVYRLQHRKN